MGTLVDFPLKAVAFVLLSLLPELLRLPRGPFKGSPGMQSRTKTHKPLLLMRISIPNISDGFFCFFLKKKPNFSKLFDGDS